MSEETLLIEQLPTLIPNATSLVNGVQLTITQVVAQLTAHRATIQELLAARAQVDDLIIQQKAQRAAVQITMEGVKAWVAANLGTASSVYRALGFAAAKRSVTSTAAKAAAVVKTQATRLKRHIMGPKQREEIPPATAPAPTAPEPTAAAPTVKR